MFYPKVLCSLTTHCPSGHSWQEKLVEISEIRLNEFAVFLTGLKLEGRKELYKSLLSLQKKFKFSIPFVHATFDMEESEYWFFIKNFQTEFFNIHPVRDFPLTNPLSDLIRSSILIENASTDGGYLLSNDLIGFKGACFDLSHLEDQRRKSTLNYILMSKFPSSHFIGANHISAVPKDLNLLSSHLSKEFSDFDYLEKYGKEFFGKYAAIEIENPIKYQLEIRDYLLEIISRKTRVIQSA